MQIQWYIKQTWIAIMEFYNFKLLILSSYIAFSHKLVFELERLFMYYNSLYMACSNDNFFYSFT